MLKTFLFMYVSIYDAHYACMFVRTRLMCQSVCMYYAVYMFVYG